MSNKLERMGKEVVVTKFMALSHYLSEQTEKTMKMSEVTLIISLRFEPGTSETCVLPT